MLKDKLKALFGKVIVCRGVLATPSNLGPPQTQTA